jgi:hypothetical protein
MLKPTNILRYYTCWIEGLDQEEALKELKFIEKIKTTQVPTKKKKLSIKN